MKNILFLVLFMLPIQLLLAQSPAACDCYDRLTNLSVYYEQKGALKEAMEVLEKGMHFKPRAKWNPYDYFRLGTLHALRKNTKLACEYLGEALKRGFNIAYLEDEKFDELRKTSHWKDLLAEVEASKRNYQKEINLTYRLAIEDIRGSDQTIRRLIKVPDSTFQQLDSINYVRLKALIDKFGYPDMERHGFDAGQGAYLILLHASMYTEESYQEILGILNTAIESFGYKRSNLAQFIDRREVWHHQRTQIYGTWNDYRGKTFNEMRSLENIDELRFKYNLLRLKEQAIIEQRSTPASYQEKAYPENYFCGHIFKLE